MLMRLCIFADALAQRRLDRGGALALFEPRRNFAKIAAHVAPSRGRAHGLGERLWLIGGRVAGWGRRSGAGTGQSRVGNVRSEPGEPLAAAGRADRCARGRLGNAAEPDADLGLAVLALIFIDRHSAPFAVAGETAPMQGSVLWCAPAHCGWV